MDGIVSYCQRCRRPFRPKWDGQKRCHKCVTNPQPTRAIPKQEDPMEKTCDKDGCHNTFEATGAGKRLYCDKHFVGGKSKGKKRTGPKSPVPNIPNPPPVPPIKTPPAPAGIGIPLELLLGGATLKAYPNQVTVESTGIIVTISGSNLKLGVSTRKTDG